MGQAVAAHPKLCCVSWSRRDEFRDTEPSKPADGMATGQRTPMLNGSPLSEIPQAESNIIGALLLDPAKIDSVSRILQPTSFYCEAYAILYGTVLALRERGEIIDLVTVSAALRANGKLERVGGAHKIAELHASVPTAANVEAHAVIIRDLAMQRDIRQAGIAIAHRACDPQPDVAALIHYSEAQLAEATGAAFPETGWGPLVPLDHACDLPEFPLEELPPWLRAIASELARAYQVPPELPAMYALALVAGAAAGKYVVQVRPGWRMPPVLYVLVALPPSERKSPVINVLAEPMRAWERARAAEIATAREEALIRVAQARAQADGALRALTRPPKEDADSDALAMTHTKAAQALAKAEAAVLPEARLIVEYATPEALAERMADHGDRQIILSDEGAGVLAMTGRYSKWGGADLDLLLRGYDGMPYTPARITRATRPMAAATLTIALAAQPAAVVNMLRAVPEIRDRGLFARFLALLPRPRVGSRQVRSEPVSATTLAQYDRLMRAILDLPDLYVEEQLAPRELRLSSAADDAIAAYEAALEPELGHGGRYERIAAYTGKLAGTAGRIAAVLHIADSAACDGGVHFVHAGAPSEIPRETAERAVRIAQVCLAHAEALEDYLAAPPELEGARRIEVWLRRHGKPVVSDREILRGTRGTVVLGTAEQRDASLKLLERHGYLRRPQALTGPPGRPSTRWEVHPQILTPSEHARSHGQNGRCVTQQAEHVSSVHIVPASQPLPVDADATCPSAHPHAASRVCRTCIMLRDAEVVG